MDVRVELSQFEFLDLSQTNDFENIFEELFSLIKNESYGIEDDQTLSVHVWFKFQWTRDLLCWSVPSSEALSGIGMCEDGFVGDDAPYVVCPSIDDNPGMPGTMDQKDSNVRNEVQSKRRKLMDEFDIIPEVREWLEGAGSCVYACKAQA